MNRVRMRFASFDSWGRTVCEHYHMIKWRTATPDQMAKMLTALKSDLSAPTEEWPLKDFYLWLGARKVIECAEPWA